MSTIINIEADHDATALVLDSGDRFARDGRKPRKKKPRDEAQELLRKLNGWWDEAREFHAANRREQLKDADFYDHHQIDPDHANVMLDRGQMPSVYNLVALAIDWLLGTERRTRIEGKIHPRGPEDTEPALAKEQVMKYVDDANFAGFERSKAFAHAAKVGVGWLEECVVQNPGVEPIARRHVDWKQMWWDPFSQRQDLSDARYITRRKWLDLDYAQAMWPKHAASIEAQARQATEFDLSDSDDLADLPALFINRDWRSQNDTGATIFGSAAVDRQFRRRVPVNETWYKKPVPVQTMASLDPDMNGQEFDQTNPAHAEAVQAGLVTLIDGVAERVFVAFWIKGLVLDDRPSPYRHQCYPFTAIWAKREDRTGLPYGYIRGMRDAQVDYNKRRSKALWLLSVNRLIFEEGAIDKADEDEVLDEAARPDARIRVAKNALAENRVKFEWGADMASGQIALMEQAKNHILEGSGITKENLGQDSNAISGRAILAKQQQGAVSTAELFDNYRFAIQCSGQKVLSLIEQYMSLPKRLRILGPNGKVDWLIVNEPQIDPMTGEVFFANDLSESLADFVVDQQDYRETMRMAMAEQLFEVLGKLPPEVQINLLDIAVELTDLPNRDELVARIRQLNGHRPAGEEPTAEEQALDAERAAAEQQAQQAAAELDMQERGARIRKDLATAARQEAEAKRIGVQGRRAAIETADLLNAALPLAPAADRLYEAPQQTMEEETR
jgi:hypothetical protein